MFALYYARASLCDAFIGITITPDTMMFPVPPFSRIVAFHIATAASLAALSSGGAPAQAVQAVPVPPETLIRVTDHGAVPDDKGDDSAAVMAALDACRRVENPVLLFPSGVYRFSRDATPGINVITVVDFKRITIRGEPGTTLVVCDTQPTKLFAFFNCETVRVSGIDVDWDPLPFAAGRVIAVSGNTLDVEVIAPHVARADTPVHGITVFDSETHLPLPAGHPRFYLLSQKNFNKRATVPSPGVLRVEVSAKPEILVATPKGRKMPDVGEHVLVCYRVRGSMAFFARHCGDVEFLDTRVFATPGMGFQVNNTESVVMERCQVTPKPGSGRWMSTTVDATHFNMIRREARIIDCVFENMGDDGANMHGIYSRLVWRIDNRRIVIEGGRGAGISPIPDYRVGDRLEFGSAQAPMRAAFTASVVESRSFDDAGQPRHRVLLDRDLPLEFGSGTTIGNASETPRFEMRGCIVRGNRGSGIRVKTRGAIVEKCVFENNAAPGVQIACDDDLHYESIATRDVIIRDNVFRNSILRTEAGRKRIDPEVHENILIENNRFEWTRNERTPALILNSLNGAVVRGNTFSGFKTKPVSISKSRGVREENNVTK